MYGRNNHSDLFMNRNTAGHDYYCSLFTIDHFYPVHSLSVFMITIHILKVTCGRGVSVVMYSCSSICIETRFSIGQLHVRAQEFISV